MSPGSRSSRHHRRPVISSIPAAPAVPGTQEQTRLGEGPVLRSPGGGLMHAAGRVGGDGVGRRAVPQAPEPRPQSSPTVNVSQQTQREWPQAWPLRLVTPPSCPGAVHRTTLGRVAAGSHAGLSRGPWAKGLRQGAGRAGPLLWAPGPTPTWPCQPAGTMHGEALLQGSPSEPPRLAAPPDSLSSPPVPCPPPQRFPLCFALGCLPPLL